MKKLQSLSFLATLAIALGMISWGSALHAQSTPSAPTAPANQQTRPAPPPDAPSAVTSCYHGGAGL